jgi:hypothetical protein
MSLLSSTEPLSCNLSEGLLVEYEEDDGKGSISTLLRYDDLAESLEA